jgi:hypothetical protein
MVIWAKPKAWFDFLLTFSVLPVGFDLSVAVCATLLPKPLPYTSQLALQIAREIVGLHLQVGVWDSLLLGTNRPVCVPEAVPLPGCFILSEYLGFPIMARNLSLLFEDVLRTFGIILA